MPQAPAPSRLVTVLIYIAWISIAGMVISALAALATGLAKGAGSSELNFALGFAVLAAFFILASAVVSLAGRRYTVQPVAALGAAVLCVAILLPIIRKRALEGCNRVPCASNLRQIGQAVFLYAEDHNGLCPAKLDDLITATDLSPTVFVCPDSHDRPADPKRPLAAQFAQPGHCSYRYLTPGVRLADLSDDAPMATEDPANHDNEGANVLFGDGHVEWFTIAGFRQLLATTRPATQPHSNATR